MRAPLTPRLVGRVHAFGIGTSANRELVRRLAAAGHGVHDFVEAFDRSMESKVMDALRDAMLVSTARVCACVCGGVRV